MPWVSAWIGQICAQHTPRAILFGVEGPSMFKHGSKCDLFSCLCRQEMKVRHETKRSTILLCHDTQGAERAAPNLCHSTAECWTLFLLMAQAAAQVKYWKLFRKMLNLYWPRVRWRTMSRSCSLLPDPPPLLILILPCRRKLRSSSPRSRSYGVWATVIYLISC